MSKQITMLRLTVLRPSRLSCAFVAIAVARLLPIATADSITVKGKRYENVYVGLSADSYYIQDPEDGSMLTVPKSSVKDKEIQITSNREERAKMREQWRQRRMNKIIESAIPKSGTSKVSPLPKPKPVSKSPSAAMSAKPEIKSVQQPTIISGFGLDERKRRPDAIAIGNVAPHRAFEGMKVFMDEHGTRALTNRPEKFAGRPEYVEVPLHFDPIQVPERLRTASIVSAKKVTGSNTIDEIISYYTKQYLLDKNLVYAMIKAESNGNRRAISSAGACGLMQLMPNTARELGVKDIFDPAENIAGGTQYLATLLNLFDNDVSLALAGYNSGPGNVKKYGGIPPFEETQNYVRKVKQYQRDFQRVKSPQVMLADRVR